MSGDRLRSLVAAEIKAPVPPEVMAVATEILQLYAGVAAILFYGSCRRSRDMTGLIDLYVLYEDHAEFHRRKIAALVNWMLPPNVLAITHLGAGSPIRAKVAVMSLPQFARRMCATSIDTTIWTRFSQPCSLIYASDEAVREKILDALVLGIGTAVYWARKLGPEHATAAAGFSTLFANTYRLELRPERGAQPALIYQSNAAWFDRIFDAVGHQALDPQPLWLTRRVFGKPLNVLRLIKAAFTYAGGGDYIVAKLQRHAGVDLPLTEWQRRHPILASPCLLWRLRRLRVKNSERRFD
jgi:hypothetical protein